jgi:hypothetical protein
MMAPTHTPAFLAEALEAFFHGDTGMARKLARAPLLESQPTRVPRMFLQNTSRSDEGSRVPGIHQITSALERLSSDAT